MKSVSGDKGSESGGKVEGGLPLIALFSSSPPAPHGQPLFTSPWRMEVPHCAVRDRGGRLATGQQAMPRLF